MKFDPKAKVEAAAAKEDSRYAIPYVSLIRGADVKRLLGTDAMLAATDGRIAALVPVFEADGDEPGPLPHAALAAARKVRKGDMARVHANGTCQAHGTGGMLEVARPDREKVGRFPDVVAVVPPASKRRIVLDAKRLRALLDAIGAVDGVEIHIPDDASFDAAGGATVPIRLTTFTTANHADERSTTFGDVPAIGVIMPMHAA